MYTNQLKLDKNESAENDNGVSCETVKQHFLFCVRWKRMCIYFSRYILQSFELRIY